MLKTLLLLHLCLTIIGLQAADSSSDVKKVAEQYSQYKTCQSSCYGKGRTSWLSTIDCMNKCKPAEASDGEFDENGYPINEEKDKEAYSDFVDQNKGLKDINDVLSDFQSGCDFGPSDDDGFNENDGEEYKTQEQRDAIERARQDYYKSRGNGKSQAKNPAPGSDPAVKVALKDGKPTEDGFYRYGAGDGNYYGTERVIWQLQEAGQAMKEKGISIGIGDISKKGGGNLPPHKTHKDGKSVDLRLVGPNGRSTTCTVNNKGCYSREKTMEAIATIIDMDPNNVKLVYLNDPELRKTMRSRYPGVLFKSCPGHDNHMHINFRK